VQLRRSNRWLEGVATLPAEDEVVVDQYVMIASAARSVEEAFEETPDLEEARRWKKSSRSIPARNRLNLKSLHERFKDTFRGRLPRGKVRQEDESVSWREWLRRLGSGEARGSAAGSRKGIPLQVERPISLGPIRDLYALLATIDDVMPAESVLYLEGTSIVPEIRAFLQSHGAEKTQSVARGTLWPRPRSYHLPLSGSNLSQLRQLAARHAEPEICDHLVVYQADQVLLSAYDAGSSHVYVSRDLLPETVEALRRRLGVA
jgi:hypothetical protein